jgi:signal transduction histidine kinase
VPSDVSIAAATPHGGLRLPTLAAPRAKRSWKEVARGSRSHLGLMLAVVVLAICAGVGFQRLVHEQQNSNRHKDIDTWLVAQVELEFLRFQNAVDAFANPLRPLDRDTMLERMEIFWSRLPVLLEGEDRERLKAIPSFVKYVQRILDRLAELEAPLNALEKGQEAEFVPIREALKAMGTQIHQLVGDMMMATRAEAIGQRDKLNRLYIELIVYFIGILISGVGLIAILFRQIRKTARLLIKATEAEADASAARSQVLDAIESIPDGFVLCDPSDRVILTNSKFRELHAGVLPAGESFDFDELCSRKAAGGFTRAAAHAPEEWVAARLQRHAQPEGPFECEMSNGTWLRIAERKTVEGRTVGVYTDISSLKQREQELKVYADKLERSNNELQNFASVASHDLQEPLRKIEAFGDRLQQKYADKLVGDGVLYLDRMNDAARRMRQLINDLLTYSRVTSKANPFSPVALGEVAAEVISDLQVRIEETGGTVQVGPMPVIDADATQMRQLFQNLIANALKFRHKDTAPVVRVSARLFTPPASSGEPAGEMCEITIADNGIGFDEKYVDRIFAIFQRLHGRTEYEGTGIGLATCRKLVERHGGTITARSVPGQGATFIALLPVKQIAAA